VSGEPLSRVCSIRHPLQWRVVGLATGLLVVRGLVEKEKRHGAKTLCLLLFLGIGDRTWVATRRRSHDTCRFAWAKLLPRIAEEYPLFRSACGRAIGVIDFIDDPGPIRNTFTHFGEPVEPPPVSQARNPLPTGASSSTSPTTAMVSRPSPTSSESSTSTRSKTRRNGTGERTAATVKTVLRMEFSRGFARLEGRPSRRKARSRKIG
jgi:hypothetical protein